MGAKKNLIGQKFGRLTVLEETDERGTQGGVIWKCKCDCGKIVYKPTVALTRKRGTKSCGCYNRDMSILKNTKNIIGEKYGMLTVVAQAPRPKNARRRGSWWYCDCDCGSKNFIANANHLKNGDNKSCGCLSSSNEVKIQRLFQKLNINYERQYMFDDCINPETGWKLKFDFAVLDNQNNLRFLIEYDGEQHFYGTRFEKDIKKRNELNQQRVIFDNIKNKYCEEHGIKLYRINYKQRDDLENVVLSILKKEKHNV